MDKFEEYIKARYPVDYEHLKEKYPNVPVGEFYGDEKDLWNCKQAELDHLNEVLEERKKEWLEAIKLGTYFQEAAKPLKDEVDQLQSQINEMAELGVSQESAIREKDKRIEELEMWIKGQIETLKCASKSWVYTEREQNIMLSQADDLEKALRGEHE